MRFLLVGHNEKDITLLRQGVLFRLLGAPRESSQTWGVAIEQIVISEALGDTRQWFHQLSGTFQKASENEKLTVVVSGIRPHCLNPLIDSGVESVIAMLILTFPDICWIFGTIKGYKEADGAKKSELDRFRSAHGVANLFHPEENMLFDGSGLRDWVRQRAVENVQTSQDASYLSRRLELAISLDEETPYSYLHAYTAYRFGFRAVAVDSAALADHLLGEDSTALAPLLAFEDIYINFLDGSPGMSWLDASGQDSNGRAKRWPRLEHAKYRIFITSGQRFPGDELKWQRNNAYIADQKARLADRREGNICKLYKPYAGTLRLWGESGLTRRLCWKDTTTGRMHRGVAPGFHWPPAKGSFSSSEHGHSSPGVLLAIAEKLIERAERLLPDVRSVQRAVNGAVLATDALEVLGGRTPTIAIEALQLKHHFEVVAECQFAGVEHHILLDERFDEIERDVKMISRWFGPPQQRVASLNAQIAILTDLVRVFREYYQFDEEQACLQRVRKLHRLVWFHRHKVWLALIYPFRWYVEFLLGSIARLVGAIGLWIVILAFLYLATGNSPLSLADALHAAFISFVSIQPDTTDPNRVVTAFAMVSGATHLGIFISHLYSLVARK